ncbi:hypothetical protein [Thalassomonas actiniarum]|uniref:Uncharacterized protein n=1 Tax=Thalassomonas actiniarum TaxID=485447 RepID=A0AAE9YS50_9GAMM|nr:hypothetical protein [Thalassomonas actiniarum]WDE00220.1 hypothetical protein SG35_006085 [Thalassomonas actiniarum]
MANPNDMPEFHSVKVSLTENIPALITKLPLAAYASSYTPLTNKGGKYHV